jgi:hypothetical protein
MNKMRGAKSKVRKLKNKDHPNIHCPDLLRQLDFHFYFLFRVRFKIDITYS